MVDWATLGGEGPGHALRLLRPGRCTRRMPPWSRGDGLNTWGCCPICALGVAARLQKDIEVRAAGRADRRDDRVVTVNGSVASLEPSRPWPGSA